MSLLTWLYGDAENADRAAAADAALRQDNIRLYGSSGMIQDKIAGQDGVDVWVQPSEQEKQVNEAFKSGLQDGANNITGFVSGVFGFVGRALGAILLGIPVWVWLAVAAFIWWKLGTPGLGKLKKKLA